MRMSNLFGQTLRKIPSDAQVKSHQLLVKAGFIRQLGAGIFSYLHLAKRTVTKIENIMREEMNRIGGQEISMPVIHPADIWKETGRWYEIGSEMGRFIDKDKRDMVLAMTHEEAVADLVRSEIQSYKQLPRLIYHIQTKWRDDPRPRAGLIRVREFTMKDSYSLDADWQGLDAQYRAHYQAYFNIYNRCNIPVVAVKSDVGMMGGKLAHEFIYLTPIGEDTLIICNECGYMANRQIAKFLKPATTKEKHLSIKKVNTPGVTSIEELSELLNVPKSKTAKVIFRAATIMDDQKDVEKLVLALIRGDMNLNETKLANVIKAKSLREANAEEILGAGAIPGYASPIGLKDVLVVVDDLIPVMPNLITGANEENYHLLNVNYGRDFKADIIEDIALAEEGFGCPDCGSSLKASRGVEVGNIFKLGTRYSTAMGCTFLDKNGQIKPVIMGSYGIGVGRLLACITEQHNDEKGLIWPISVAPYQVHITSLKDGENLAQRIYNDLQLSNIEVLFDDREETAGVKLSDADLIGLPIRLTVSKRSIESGGIELKLRHSSLPSIIPVDEIKTRILRLIDDLMSQINQNVVTRHYAE